MILKPLTSGKSNQVPTPSASTRVLPPLTSLKTAPAVVQQKKVEKPKVEIKPAIKSIDSPKSVFQNIQDAVAKIAKPKKDEGLGAPIGRLLQKIPDTTIKIPEKYKSEGLYDEIVEFTSGLPGSIAQSYGRSLELLSTPDGKKQLKEGAKNLPKTISEIKKNIDSKEWGKAFTTAFSNPALSVALDVSDFIPIAGVVGFGVKKTLGGLRKTAQQVVKEGIEEVEKKVVKTVTTVPANKLIPKLEAEMKKKGIFWEDIEKSVGRKLDQGRELDLRIALERVNKVEVKTTEPIIKTEAKTIPEDTKRISTYTKTYRKGKMLSADDVREVYTPEGYNRINSAKFHERSSALTDKIFDEDVKTLKKGDNYLFTAGVSGSGKTSAIRENTSVFKDFTLGLDGNFSSSKSLTKVEKVLEKGANVGIIFTYRKPLDAWVNGVIKRATNPKNGRVVPLDVFLKNLTDSKERVLEAYKKFGDKVSIQVIDNSRGKGNSKVVPDPIDFLNKINYNVTNEKRKILRLTEEKFRKGEISAEVRRALIGKETISKSQPQRAKQRATPVTPKTVSVPREQLPVKQGQSRVFERLQKEHPEQLKGELPYDQAVLKTEFDKATKRIVKDKQDAFDVAMGRKNVSDIESVATNIEMAERALEEGNTKLYEKLVRNRSIAQTKRGQAIVAEKASIEDNSTARYVKELLSARLDNLGKRYLSGLKEGSTIKKRATEIIEGKANQLQVRIQRGKLDTKTALKLLDELACV